MNEIVRYTFEETRQLADTMAKSQLFAEVDTNKAIVKILAGREMGLGEFSAMAGIHIIKGKPVLGANLIATLIKNDPRYDYRIVTFTEQECSIDFYEQGKVTGNSSFSMTDAQKAGLGGDNWRKFPRNMLFARAISNGAKWYCPGVFGGAPVYTPDEFGLDTDGEGDVIIDVTATTQKPGSGNGGHQVEPEKTEGERLVEELDTLGASVWFEGWPTEKARLRADKNVKGVKGALGYVHQYIRNLGDAQALFDHVEPLWGLGAAVLMILEQMAQSKVKVDTLRLLKACYLVVYQENLPLSGSVAEQAENIATCYQIAAIPDTDGVQ